MLLCEPFDSTSNRLESAQAGLFERKLVKDFFQVFFSMFYVLSNKLAVRSLTLQHVRKCHQTASTSLTFECLWNPLFFCFWEQKTVCSGFNDKVKIITKYQLHSPVCLRNCWIKQVQALLFFRFHSCDLAKVLCKVLLHVTKSVCAPVVFAD